MTITDLDALISEVKEKSNILNIYFTITYSANGKYVEFYLDHDKNKHLHTMSLDDLCSTDNLEILKQTLLEHAKKLVSKATSNNVNEVGWAQCNQCGWGTDVYKYGDNYTSGNSCPQCLVGTYNINWDHYN